MNETVFQYFYIEQIAEDIRQIAEKADLKMIKH
jgi:hypothetical protein